MFTGIIEAIGEVAAMERRGDDLRLRINSGVLDLADLKLGDSVATNGVCLTVIDLPGDGYWADVSAETLTCSNYDQLKVGTRCNLEKAMTPTTRLGGHLVSGHVDGVGEVLSRWDEGRSVRFRIGAPAALAKFIAAKGSITINGVSLTVNNVDGSEFELNIVPHTLQETTLQEMRGGSRLNLEVDVIARYLERLLQGEQAAEKQSGGLGRDFLAAHGFLGGGA